MSTDTSREVELYDWAREDAETITVQPAEVGPPVDPPEHPRTWATLDALPEMAPILPAWLRSPAQRRQYARWSVLWVLWHTGYHTAYSYRYAARVLRWAPVGLWRVLRVLGRWVADVDGRLDDGPQLRREHPTETLHLMEAHDRHVKRRARGALVAVVLVATAGTLGWVLAPWWARAAAVVVVLVGLARVGRPKDRPIVDRVSIAGGYRKLTAEQVRAALVSIGMAAMRSPDSVSFPREISRDGPGYLATVDLPAGVEAAEVIDRRGKLASGLRVPVDQCWPEPAEGHAGRLALWVGDQPASKTRQPAWPLARTGTVDVFVPFPVATDPRLRPVKASLVARNWLVGGVPGSGKSAAIRLLCLAAALDPRAELHVFELKGSGDFDPLEQVAAGYGSGADDDTAQSALSTLRWARRECARRADVVKAMARAGKAPDHKVTPELATAPDLGLHPVVVTIDEAQELFGHPRYGKEAADLATAVVKLGRAVGVILIVGTQRPDKDSLPSGLSANVNTRACFAVQDQVANDMILGTSSYRLGHRATLFAPERDAGWCWLKGVGDPTPARTYYLDNEQTRRVAARAITLRGGPVEHEPRDERLRWDITVDVSACWPDGEEAVWSEVLVSRLAQLRPEVYGRYDVQALNAALRAAGVQPRQLHRKVDGAGITRYGVRRADVDSARQAIDSAPASAQTDALSRDIAR
jgi:S-DNA-T family DNA segregation ATPase FtsK/SpoIIIE